MLNSASTRLACLEDVEIDVSPPGAPQHLSGGVSLLLRTTGMSATSLPVMSSRSALPVPLQTLTLTRLHLKGQCIVVEDELPWAALFPLPHILIASSCYHLLTVLCAAGSSCIEVMYHFLHTWSYKCGKLIAVR